MPSGRKTHDRPAHGAANVAAAAPAPAKYGSLVTCLTNELPTALFIYREGRFVYANDAARELTGYAPEELVGKPVWSIVRLDFQDSIRERAAARERGELDSAHYEIPIVTKKGEERWVDLHVTTRVLDGHPTMVGVAFDATERKRTERLQKALYRIASAASAAEDLDQLYVTIHDILNELMDARNCYIALYDAATETVSFPYYIDLQSQRPAPRKGFRGLTEYVIREGKPTLVTAELYEKLIRRGEVQRSGGHSADWLGVPLKRGENIFGVLVVQSYAPEVRFGNKEVEILTFVSQQIANAIEHMRQQKALHESEEWHRLAFERNLSGVYRSTVDGKVLDANPAMWQMFGFSSKEEMLRTSAINIYDAPEDRAAIIAELKEKRTIKSFEKKMRRKDGSPIWVLDSMSLVPDAKGEYTLLEGTIIDITPRQLVQEKLRESEQRYRALIENAGDLIYTQNLNGDFTSVNEAILRTTGYTREECLRMGVADVVVPEHLETALERTRRKLAGEELQAPYVVDIFTKNRDRLTIEISTRLIHENGKPAGIQGIARNITERQRAEQALRESEAKFRAVAETALTAIFIYQTDRFQYVNAATETISGYSRDELMRLTLWDIVHPDFRELVQSRSSARLRGENVPSRYEIKIVNKAGEARWVDVTFQRIEFDGRPAVLGTALDTSERKQVEETLHVQKAYLEQLFESAPEAIVLLDNDARVLRANQEFTRMFGYTAEEIVGTGVDTLIVPPEQISEARRLSARAAAGETIALETVRRRKDGSSLDVAIIATPIQGGGGQIAVYAMYRDITSAKRAEEALARSEQRFRSLVQSSSDLITLFDLKGDIEYISPSSERWLGYPPEQIVGRPGLDFVHPEDLDRTRNMFTLWRSQQREGLPVEMRLRHRDGTYRTFEAVSNVLREKDQVTGLLVSSREISDRKRAARLQSALYRIADTASSAQDLNGLYATIHGILGELMYAKNCYIAILENHGKTISFPYFVDEKDAPPPPRSYGHGLTEYVLRSGQPLLATPEMVAELIEKGEVIRSGSPSKGWIGIPLKTGEQSYGALVLQSYEPDVKFGEQEKEILTFVSQQIANAVEHRRNQEELRESEAKLRAVAESAASAIYIHNGVRFLYVNPATLLMSGFSREELMAMKPTELAHPADRAMVEERMRARLAGSQEHGRYEFRVVTRHGEERWLDATNSKMIFDGQPAIAATAIDITERKRAEQLQSALYRIADVTSSAEQLPEFYAKIHAIVGELVYARNFYIALYDATTHSITFPYAVDEADTFPNPTTPVPSGRGLTEYVLRTGQSVLAPPDGFEELIRKGEVESVGAPSVDWMGVPLKKGQTTFGVLALQSYTENVRFRARDLELLTFVSQHVASAIEHKRNEEALRRSEARYRSLVQSAVYGIFRSSIDDRFLDVNPALVSMLGYDSDADLMRMRIGADVYVEPGDRDRLVQLCLRTGRLESEEVRWRRKDGALITVRLSGRPVLNERGEAEGFEIIAEDVTEHRQLEEQLRQSQKMEAVGRLAGGVAHDFNNLLTVIKGYSELMIEELPAKDPMREEVEEVRKAADRAASLTRQPLACSRQQVMAPRIIDLNTVVENMDKLLRRLLGEDVELYTSLDKHLGAVKADPGQIEQVIMNLAVNARDAMPKGGKLTVETRNVALDELYAREHATVKAGNYALVAVSDTGVGMDAETRSHVFEPFFTTKEQGKGTGLGLSTVYGIVKQSGGYIWVYSELGMGTTFKVYLPRVDARVDISSGVTKAVPRTGHETVLLVEDEDGVRALIRQVLHRAGYTVLQARHGGEALLTCERHEGKIDLLLTDVVLTQMSGHELALRLLKLRPDMKVLYMSGYTDEAVVHHGVLTAGSAFLQKPFTNEALARKVREVLDMSPPKPN